MYKKKFWVRIIEAVNRIFVIEPEVIYLGDKIPASSLILCNHVGASGPVVWELYMDRMYFWATHEITEGPVSIYHYLSEVFFSGKRHWNPTVAKIIGFLLAPFMALYISGWHVIPSYPDMRLSKTIKETIKVLKENGSVLIFPEDSSQGYYDVLRSLHPGFCLAGEAALKSGIDADVVVAYLEKGKNRRLIIDKPVKYSVLKEKYCSRDAITDFVCSRINELGKS